MPSANPGRGEQAPVPGSTEPITAASTKTLRKTGKRVPVWETFREIPLISQPRARQRAPAQAQADGQARLGFPAGNEIRSKNARKINPRRYKSFSLSRASIPGPAGPSRPGCGASPVPGSPSGTRDRGGKFTNEA